LDSKVFSLDMGSMIAGTKYRGDFEKKLKSLLKEVSKIKNAILFIDEFIQLLEQEVLGDLLWMLQIF